MLALYLGRMRHLSSLQGPRMIDELRGDARRRPPDAGLPRRRSQRIAEKYSPRQQHASTWAGSTSIPVALEGALKLKEISYIHAEGYPAAEMKHGPIALVDENTPSVFLMPRGAVFDKVMSNLEEIKARGGPVIAVASEGDEEVAARGRRRDLRARGAGVPAAAGGGRCRCSCWRITSPLLRGCDVDKPRNLAKSVTVE